MSRNLATTGKPRKTAGTASAGTADKRRRDGRPVPRPPAHPPRRSAARWPLIAAIVVATLLAAAVGYAVRSGTGAGGGAAQAFGHVHGMAVGDGGKLFVATHVGLFRIDGPDTAIRVSTDAPDLMGFTAAGPGRFLASGHPDADSDAPANLGLIESTDGGVTWETMSLSGAADFHGLRAAHDAVYGYNSTDGAFMVSTDRRTWDRRSVVALGAFAVSPTDPDTIVGAGQAGLQRSTDGGRTWNALTGVPAFSDMSWDTAAGLWGVTGDGAVWQSTDGGSWQRRGQVPGEPHALTAHSSALYAAVTGDKIVASTDGGATWTPRYTP